MESQEGRRKLLFLNSGFLLLLLVEVFVPMLSFSVSF